MQLFIKETIVLLLYWNVITQAGFHLTGIFEKGKMYSETSEKN